MRFITLLTAVGSFLASQTNIVEARRAIDNGEQNEVSEQTAAKTQADIVVLADESGSIGYDRYSDIIIPAIKDLANEFSLAPNQVRVAAITFSSENYEQVHFKLDSPEATNKEAFIGTVQDKVLRSYRGGSTWPYSALRAVDEQLQFHAQTRPGVPFVTMFITDGEVYDAERSLQALADIKKNPDAKLVCVGIADGARSDFLQKACDPNFTFKAEDFGKFRGVMRTLAKRVN
ncbi:MAG TPA: VWA domain-containing protein, partial [Gammaproteobacteria bacterium]|nr:VWA domain-containing protein [Gammaproteobacteria bacterium]